MAESPQNPRANSEKKSLTGTSLVSLAVLTVLAFLVMGYHPGLEDDAFYLAAIKRNLNPALFPHDADFFRLQFQATIFDKLIAWSIRLTHLPIAWAALLWQLLAIFLLLFGCWRIARRCFSDAQAQWAAVALIAVLLTLPVSGVAITLCDQYLHPRTLATVAILAAIAEVMDRRAWRAAILLAIAFLIHAIMAGFGISFCAFLFWSMRPGSERKQLHMPVAAVLFPLGWMFEPGSEAWRQAASTRSFYYISRWHWYEWLGVFGPLLLLFAFRRFLRPRGDSPLLALVSSLLYYGAFQTVVGLAIMLPPGLERLRPFEPMRYLHLLYLLFFLIAGGLLGRYVLKRHVYRWILLFLPLGAGMFYAQRQMLPATEHLELPGARPQNSWVQAFGWVRENTPVDALFALDPHYIEFPGEDYHGFRALAERSALADYVKDGGMAARVPRLAPRWLKEVNAQSGWQSFQAADFARLQAEFGVNWVILARPAHKPGEDRQVEDRTGSAAMNCRYQNQQVEVCRLY